MSGQPKIITRSAQNSSSVISSIYKSRMTILDQLRVQNYNTDEYAGFTVNEVNSMSQNSQLDMLLEQNNPDESGRKRKIYIRYYLTKKLLQGNIQEIIDDLFNFEEVLKKEDNLIIIIKDEPNETLVNLQKHIWEQDKIFLIILNIKRLQFNILNHESVPPHRVMSNDEVAVVKKRYNIMNDGQFPEISRFDPVAQVIGIRPGQLCEITRSSKTAVTSLFYRICI
jgi:DNA-directed RNA polymerase subunit H (RpoH/RPB5)